MESHRVTDQMDGQVTATANNGHVTHFCVKYQRGKETVLCTVCCCIVQYYTVGDYDRTGCIKSILMMKLTFPSNNHVTSGGGSPEILTSRVRVRPTLTTRFCKLVRSIFGFTARTI